MTRATWVIIIGAVLLAAAGGGVAIVTGVYSDLVKRIGYAIAVAERGAAEIASGNILNNNPGDIEDANGNLIVYDTVDAGWNALYHQVSLFFSGSRIYDPSMTINQVAQKYVGTSDWPNWARNVSNILGVSPDTPLSAIV